MGQPRSWVGLPDVPPAAPKPWPALEEIAAIIREAEGSPLYESLVLLGYTGCRIGEALGVKWSDSELEKGTWLLSRTTAVNLEGKVVLGDRTKTGESRPVDLRPVFVDALRAQRARVAALKLKAGPRWQEDDPVFPTVTGRPQDSRNIWKEYRRWLSGRAASTPSTRSDTSCSSQSHLVR